MKEYKVVWERACFGESTVKADSLDEAKKKAEAGEDENFDWYDDYEQIYIRTITELDEEGDETDVYMELD